MDSALLGSMWTGGLGLLTARWLACCGGRSVVLVSRSGTLARDSATEWESARLSGVAAAAERCDAGDPGDVRRLLIGDFNWVMYLEDRYHMDSEDPERIDVLS